CARNYGLYYFDYW
nr:immunoglobulin heavy chain junction region [Mus musculus]